MAGTMQPKGLTAIRAHNSVNNGSLWFLAAMLKSASIYDFLQNVFGIRGSCLAMWISPKRGSFLYLTGFDVARDVARTTAVEGDLHCSSACIIYRRALLPRGTTGRAACRHLHVGGG